MGTDRRSLDAGDRQAVAGGVRNAFPRRIVFTGCRDSDRNQRMWSTPFGTSEGFTARRGASAAASVVPL